MNFSVNDLKTKWNFENCSMGFISPLEDHPLDFHIGYSQPGQKCFLVVGIDKINNISSSQAIKVDVIEVDNSIYALRFTLIFESLDELFIRLCWDLINSSKNVINPQEVLMKRYESWIKLLQKVKREKLPWCSQKGLLGELLYLEECIDLYGIKNALTAWVGPEGSDQDYIFVEKWVEIKTTGIASNSVTISSLEQFDRSDYGELKVYFLDKSPRTSATITLGEKIESIATMLHDESDIDEFWCKLSCCGIFESDIDDYKDKSYRLSGNKVFSINNSFPRLTRKTVPTSVISAKYTLDLAMINGFLIREN